MNPLKQIFADDTGAISSMRVVFVLVVLMVVATWCVLSIRANAFVPIPPTVLGLVITAFGGKTLQSLT